MRIYRSRVLIFVAAVFVNFFVIWPRFRFFLSMNFVYHLKSCFFVKRLNPSKHLRCPDEPNSSKKHSSPKKPNHENLKINTKLKNEERHDDKISEVKPEHKLAIIVPFR